MLRCPFENCTPRTYGSLLSSPPASLPTNSKVHPLIFQPSAVFAPPFVLFFFWSNSKPPSLFFALAGALEGLPLRFLTSERRVFRTTPSLSSLSAQPISELTYSTAYPICHPMLSTVAFQCSIANASADLQGLNLGGSRSDLLQLFSRAKPRQRLHESWSGLRSYDRGTHRLHNLDA